MKIEREKSEKLNDRMKLVELNRVQVNGFIGERINITFKKNLLALDVDTDFLLPFQRKEWKAGYVGLGKLMDAVVHFASYTKNPSVLSLKKHIVDEVIRIQSPNGYIGTYPPEKRMAPDTWGIHEMSYLIYGLTSNYRYFGEQKSLESAIKMADYLLARLSKSISDHTRRGSFSIELFTLGFERAMISLYTATGKKRFLNQTSHLLEWNQKIVLGRYGKIEGHAYAFLYRCIAQLELYRILGNEKLLLQSKRVINFLRKEGGLLITGSSGKHECWYTDQSGDGEIEETCATAYLIFFLDNLFRLEGNPLYGDIMERTIYNALFAAQSPNGREIRYYTAFEGKRIYWPKDTYCCPNNYRRVVATLPRLIYYKSQGGLVINLYTTSQLKIEIVPGLQLEIHQETDYPLSGKVVLYINPSKKIQFPIWLRIPSWCNKAHASVNGKFISVSNNRSFLMIEQEWKTGDKIVLNMEMKWRFIKGFNKQKGRVAVMRGPLLFCLNPKRNPLITKEKNLRDIIIDPTTIQPPEKDDTLQPREIICKIKARNYRDSIRKSPDMDLVLTEFSDPDGEITYFLTSDINEAVDDELSIDS